MTDLTWNDLSNSKYLNAESVAGKRISATVKKIVVEEMRDGSEVGVAYFKEFEEGVTLNRTRRRVLAEATGSPRVADAVGLKLVICEGLTQFRGEDVPTIKFVPATPVGEQIGDEVPDHAKAPPKRKRNNFK